MPRKVAKTTTDERVMGIPHDLVRHDEVYALSGTLPRLWGMDFMKIRELHKRGYTGKGVTIAINDTGYKAHPYLPKPVFTKDFTGSSSGVTDRNGHGVHTAGTALGRRDDNGNSLGVAPDADLIVIKVLGDNGSGSTSGINRGRIEAAKAGADIISESLGDGGGPPIKEDIDAFNAAYDAGVSICVAALGNAGFRGVGRPGSYKENAGIAAIREDGKRADFSSVGDPADLATPGQNIISCGLNNNLVSMSGTSMATPFCAGLFALIIQYMQENGFPALKGWKAWREFFSDPRFVLDAGTPGKDKEYGYGIPQVSKIVDWMLEPKNV